MIRISELLWRYLREPWLICRSILEYALTRGRLDRWLQKTGFFSFKSRFFRHRTRLPNSCVVVCRPEDERIISEIYKNSCYARPTISECDTVIDVGAHIGLFTAYAAKRCPCGLVIAIEPAALNLEILYENIGLNKLTNVKVYECAVADRPGNEKLFSLGDSALYTFHPTQKTSELLSEVVPVKTLDEIFKAETLSVCHLLKIDVERSEWQVLQGAPQTLKATKQVIMEISKDIDSGLPKQIIRFLGSMGFICSVEAETPGAITLYAGRSQDDGHKNSQDAKSLPF